MTRFLQYRPSDIYVKKNQKSVQGRFKQNKKWMPIGATVLKTFFILGAAILFSCI